MHLFPKTHLPCSLYCLPIEQASLPKIPGDIPEQALDKSQALIWGAGAFCFGFLQRCFQKRIGIGGGLKKKTVSNIPGDLIILSKAICDICRPTSNSYNH